MFPGAWTATSASHSPFRRYLTILEALRDAPARGNTRRHNSTTDADTPRQGLIAINYPARAFGITRHLSITEALKLCPSLVSQHVATWREGDDAWAYRPDAPANVATDKVSLDPYRLQSRRILALIRESLPPAQQRIEKASVDEVFLDLSAQVHEVLASRFPELARPMGDPSELLPAPSVAALNWTTDHLVPLSEEEEVQDPDWDDIALSIGAEIVRDVRAAIRERLGYTCSAGIAHNKLLSKLGSGCRKPNQQTVIRRRAVAPFLSPLKFTKIRNLGGKLGDQVTSEFGTEEVSGLLSVPLQQMISRLGTETGTWVHNSIRGIDNSEVNSRTKIKSMLSAKSFRPHISSVEQAERWIRIFAADINARLVEEGVLENKRRPKTLNLSLRHANQSRSRQTPIAPGRQLDQAYLMELGKALLGQILSEGEVWPCNNLSMAVSGFEDGVTGNMGIGSFLVKGVEAQALREVTTRVTQGDDTLGSTSQLHGSGSTSKSSDRKRRHPEGGGDIGRFFMRSPPTVTSHNHHGLPDESNNAGATSAHSHSGDDADPRGTVQVARSPAGAFPPPRTNSPLETPGKNVSGEPLPGTGGETPLGSKHSCPSNFSQTADQAGDWPSPYTCGRCNLSFADPEAQQSHKDWHLAVELQEREEGVEERVRSAFANRNGSCISRKRGGRGGRGNARGAATGTPGSRSSTSSSRQAGGRERSELEPGQRQLNFG